MEAKEIENSEPVVRFNSIGERIRAARLAKKMTQADLAREVGVTREAVSQWESGDTKGLKPANLVRTAKHLDMTVELLVFGEGFKHPISKPEETIMDRGDLTVLIDTLDKLLTILIDDLAAAVADQGVKLNEVGEKLDRVEAKIDDLIEFNATRNVSHQGRG